MIEIKDMQMFNFVVAEAKAAASTSSRSDEMRKRWLKAIGKAAEHLTTQDLTFLNFDERKGELLFLSSSNQVYSSGSACQCSAYMVNHVPCYHRAMARLLKRYFESLPVTEATPNSFITCSECLWAGFGSELAHDFDGRLEARCPKCDSESISITRRPAHANTISRIGGLER